MALPSNPITRKENYLSNIAGQTATLPSEPHTREEEYLDYIARNGGGGGGGEGDMTKAVYDDDLAVASAGGIKAYVSSAIADKVDKVNGKGLSTNDYDDSAKTIVDGVTTALSNKQDAFTPQTPLAMLDFFGDLYLGVEEDQKPTKNSRLLLDSGTIYNAIDDVYKANGLLGAKNLNRTIYTSKTSKTVVFTVNSDGTITANGTATGGDAEVGNTGTEAFIAPFDAQVILSGGVSTNAHIYPFDQTAIARPYTDSTKTTRATGQNATGTNDVSFWMEKGHSYTMGVRITQNTSVNDVVFKPMLRLASDSDSAYQPYAMTNIELTTATGSKADITSIGTNETGTTASKAYKIGDHFYRNGKFCTAKTAISSGATLTLNTNYTEGTVADSINGGFPTLSMMTTPSAVPVSGGVYQVKDITGGYKQIGKIVYFDISCKANQNIAGDNNSIIYRLPRPAHEYYFSGYLRNTNGRKPTNFLLYEVTPYGESTPVGTFTAYGDALVPDDILILRGSYEALTSI